MKRNPFDALGLPSDPALTDEQVRAAWRAIAAATHPDRPDGDLARYTQASAAYAELRTPWGRSEAWADLIEHLHDTTRCRPSPPGWEVPPSSSGRCCCSPSASATAARCGWPSAPSPPPLLSMAVLALIPGQPAAPALVAGLILWFALTARSDLAPPPRR